MRSAKEICLENNKQYLKDLKNPPAKMKMPGSGFYLKKAHRLVILGGMPGTGKSAYMSTEAALCLAEQGVLVFIMTYEMAEANVVERLQCNGGDLLCDSLADMKLSKAELDEAFKAVEDRLDRIFISSPRSIEEVQTSIQGVLDKQTTKNPKIIIVWDYLQRIPLSKIEDARLRVASNLQAILEVNRIFNAQSVVLSSLSRAGYNETSMEAFKEAGDIESDCDMAIIMRIAERNTTGEYKAVKKEDLNSARKQLEVPVLFSMVKNRHGAEIEFTMSFDKTRQKMHELTENYSVARRPVADESTPRRVFINPNAR